MSAQNSNKVKYQDWQACQLEISDFEAAVTFFMDRDLIVDFNDTGAVIVTPMVAAGVFMNPQQVIAMARNAWFAEHSNGANGR